MAKPRLDPNVWLAVLLMLACLAVVGLLPSGATVVGLVYGGY